ncbi:MAG: twin-arginine translocase TatA/TatE family subunit [Sphingomonadales bacterium]|nr:MAG: twin-arginine translocase TatA/TatE family subunit [Sphingomonadales bacterium]
MGLGSVWHWVILLLVVVLLFGRGRISDVMGDLAKGIKSFKKGLADDETPPPARPAEPSRLADTTVDVKAQSTAHEDARSS